MRDLRANNRQLWYATYQGKQMRLDEHGDITGDVVSVYSEPVPFKAHLSATRGTQGFTGTGTTSDYFGADIDYSLIISTSKMDLPIDEYSLIWKHEPDVVEGVVDYTKADYKVTAVAEGQMHMKYAIKELAKTSIEPDRPSNNGQSAHNDSFIIMP